MECVVSLGCDVRFESIVDYAPRKNGQSRQMTDTLRAREVTISKW